VASDRETEQLVAKSNADQFEVERRDLAQKNAQLEVSLNSAVNDVAFMNAQLELYTKQVQGWREALKSLAPLVAFVEGKGAVVADSGVVMKIGNAYITFGDVRAWAGVFKT